MKAYRVSWFFFCGVLGALGAFVAVTWSLSTVIALFICGCVTGSVVAMIVLDPKDESRLPGDSRRIVAKSSILAGAGTVGFGGVVGVGVGGGWVTVAAVWPLGQVTGAGGGVSVGTAVATGASAMTSRPATEAAAQPRSRLRVGRAVDMSRGGYGIVLRRAAGYTPERPTAAARVRSHG